MGDLTKIFSRAYEEGKAERAAFDLGDSHKQQLNHLRDVVAELNASPEFYARLDMQDHYLQLSIGKRSGECTVVLDVHLIGEDNRTSVLLERAERRHSGVSNGDFHDLREQQGREDLCRQLAKEMSFEEPTPFEQTLRSYTVRRPAP